jgi:DNA-binding transcriptional LysR family regulator
VRSPDDEDPQWATRRLCAANGVLVASPEFVARHGGLRSPDALREAPALGMPHPDRRVHWTLVGPDGRPVDVAASARLGCEDFAMRRQAAVAGLGVTMLPTTYADPEIAAGTLVRVLPEWNQPAATLQVVYPSQRGLAVAVRALLDALIAAFEPECERGCGPESQPAPGSRRERELHDAPESINRGVR